MSLQEPCINSFWDNCPHDILLIILSKLDMKSLINSMFVNKYWRYVVEYYSQHYNMWEKMIEEGMYDKGLAFKEKSTLDWRARDIILTAQRWNNVKNSLVCLHHHYNCEVVRSICVHKDNFIIVTNETIKYFNIENYKLMKTFDSSCLKYDETSSLSVKINPPTYLPNGRPKSGKIGYNTLTLHNKLHHSKCICMHVNELSLYDVSFLKVHLNCCYFFNKNNVLWMYSAEKCKWDVRALAKYYGNRDSISVLHVHQEDVYLLLKKGDILRVDLELRKFEKLFDLHIPLHLLDVKTFMFHTFSVICSGSVSTNKQNDKMYVSSHEHKNQVVCACPGLTCAVEHGHILLLGYEDGKIEIFLTANLLKKNITPELRFYLRSYLSTCTNKIIAIDIYEDKKAHHLFVVTDSEVCEFLICNKLF